MRATLLLVLGAAASLTACHRRDDLFANRSHEGPMPAGLASVSSVPAGPPGFVGRWAASHADCANAAWTFTAQTLQTPGAVHCTFVKVEAASAGWGTDAVCGGPGPGQAGRLTLTRSGQGASLGLTVAGGPFQLPVGLVRCPTGAVASAAPADAAKPSA